MTAKKKIIKPKARVDCGNPRQVDPDDSARDRRHPAALEQVDDSCQEAVRPVDAEQHPPLNAPSSGTLASLPDSSQLPVTDSGLAIEPEQLGRQFLRDATEQDNFESDAHWEQNEPGVYPVGQVVSEATLESAGQEGQELPESEALRTSSAGEVPEDADLEPEGREVELMSNAIHEASLFDQPRDAEDEELEEPEIDADETEGIGARHVPPGADEEAYEAEVRRLRARLRRVRSA